MATGVEASLTPSRPQFCAGGLICLWHRSQIQLCRPRADFLGAGADHYCGADGCFSKTRW